MPFLESIGLKAIEEILHRLFELRPRRFVIKLRFRSRAIRLLRGNRTRKVTFTQCRENCRG